MASYVNKIEKELKDQIADSYRQLEFSKEIINISKQNKEDKKGTLMKKLKKTAVALGLAGLLSFLPVKGAKAGILDKDVDVGVNANIEYNFKNPISNFYNDTLNPDFKNGNYTSTVQIPDWQNIDAGNSFIMEGAELFSDIKLLEGFKISPIVGYKLGKGESRYDKTYNLIDKYKMTAKNQFIRNENFDVSAPLVGLGIKLGLTDSTELSLKGDLGFYSIKGSVDYEMDRLDAAGNGYKQYRDSNYSGSGIVSSVEAGLEQKIFDFLSIGVSGGIKSGNVNTNGKEIRTQNTNKEVTEYDYSPSFNFNNFYGKVELKIKL